MMRFYLLLLLLGPLGAASQKKWGKDTSLVYLDQNLEITNAKYASFTGISIKVDGGWMVFGQYPDTTPVIRAYYKDKALRVKQGPYKAYYPGHKVAKEGFFNDNKMTGIWRFWYENGQLKDSGRVTDNFLTGLWKSWHPNGALMAETHFRETLPNASPSLPLVATSPLLPPYHGFREGAYTSWYSNGTLESTGQFTNNQKEGTWRWYHPNGAPATVETYEQGRVTGLECFDSTGRLTGDMCSLDKPALLKHYGDFRTFIYENLTWPEEARKKRITGEVEVQFTVTKEGKLQDLRITSAQPVLQKAVAALFEHMQEWYPAISHNRVINWQGYMMIPFQREVY